MRIGIDARIISRRGVGRYIENLVKNLLYTDKNNEYFIYLDKRSILNEYIGAKNARLIRLNTDNAFIYEQIILPIQASIDKIDVLHGTDNTLPLIYPFYRGKKVVTIHDTMYVRPLKKAVSRPTLKQRAVDFYNKIAIPLSARAAFRVITVSEYSKNDIIKYTGAGADKVRVIYEAADKRYSAVNDEKKAAGLRKKYSITKPFILLSAASDIRKNTIRALEAFNIFNNMTEFKYQLVMTSIGKNEMETTNIAEKIRELNLEKYIIITEYAPEEDMVLFYSTAVMFLFPSIWEGFGLQVVEAFSCGLPVVTSNNTSLAEISGGAAMLIDPFSVEDIVRGLLEVEKSAAKRKMLVEKGLKRASEFSWKITAQETLKIYEQAAGGGNS
jgi:glycosyltransferase involved in cell wall biosynthesis